MIFGVYCYLILGVFFSYVSIDVGYDRWKDDFFSPVFAVILNLLLWPIVVVTFIFMWMIGKKR